MATFQGAKYIGQLILVPRVARVHSIDLYTYLVWLLQGASKPPPSALPNQFTNVAPLFFFPLMNQYDQRINTLDLLGEDSLILGNLLYTLGTVMYAASHLPITVTMATAFLDFLWVLRFHPAV